MRKPSIRKGGTPTATVAKHQAEPATANTRDRKNLIAALDIGTSKCCVLVGRMQQEMQILGMGTVPSEGISKGTITSVEQLARQIRQAVKEAERSAGYRVNSLWVNIGGTHTEGRISQGFTTAKEPDHKITRKDINEALARASNITLPSDRELVHILTNEYVLDGESHPTRPVGIRGRQLQIGTYLVLASRACCQNTYDSVTRAGCKIEGMALQSLASGTATLSREEKELGVVLIDIGGGITDLAVFHGQGLQHAGTISVGGNHITNDLAVGLHTTPETAEELKLNCATLSHERMRESEVVTVPGVAGRDSRPIKRQDICRIVQCRVEELLDLIDASLKNSGYKHLAAAGAVLTGGASLLPGFKREAEKRLVLPVRIAYPRIQSDHAAFNPAYSTAVGLLEWGHQTRHESLSRERIDVRLIDWIKDFF